MICRGVKFHNSDTFVFDDGATAPMTKRVKPFNMISDPELTALNLPNARTYSKLLKEMRKVWPDFKESETVTLISVRMVHATEAPKTPKGH